MAADLVVVKESPFNAEADIRRLAEEITPNASHYVRSNFAVPALDPRHHHVAVGGAVRHPLRLGMEELRAMSMTSLVATMECAGNDRLRLAPLPSGEPWESGAVSTARWAGVPLGAVLDRAGLRPEAVEILVIGADQGKPKDGPHTVPFARALPLDKARHPHTLLALEMNGEPLPAHHGAPLRLVVPAWYGMASVKWVARIEAIEEPFAGYYQTRRYIYDFADGTPPVPVTEMRVKSLVTAPLEGATVPPGRVNIAGKAWSGAGRIVRVELNIDGAPEWQEARLLDAPAPYAWQSWEYEWDAAEPGRHVIRARATDSRGQRQPDVAPWNTYGYGNNAIRPVVINVRRAP
ncbi:MAG TPA: sulfite oxidase [Chloroflexota bacterium]|nr:sulfite oxidase [Chloroflexota bacterium]